MGVCCCSLAGTSACNNCPNNGGIKYDSTLVKKYPFTESELLKFSEEESECMLKELTPKTPDDVKEAFSTVMCMATHDKDVCERCGKCSIDKRFDDLFKVRDFIHGLDSSEGNE